MKTEEVIMDKDYSNALDKGSNKKRTRFCFFIQKSRCIQLVKKAKEQGKRLFLTSILLKSVFFLFILLYFISFSSPFYIMTYYQTTNSYSVFFSLPCVDPTNHNLNYDVLFFCTINRLIFF